MEDTTDSQVLNYFETVMKNFVMYKLSHTDDWIKRCIPPEIRDEMNKRHDRAKKINNVLNKPSYGIIEYINFDGYERIISRKDNWGQYFEKVFLDKTVFTYKMNVLLSLRNDIRHGRQLNNINRIRLRLHCYDILAQIHESGMPDSEDNDTIMNKLGLANIATDDR